MANQYFQFRQFRINQDKCGMKVGTDGVLLGAWCEVDGHKRILDVGTGTGLIALMLAQRNQSARIDAVELDRNACIQAADNFVNSPWRERLHLIEAEFSLFATQSVNSSYDLIVSNPPYFENSLKANGCQRTQARHTDTLSFESLIQGASHLLSENGILALIYPVAANPRITSIASEQGFQLLRQTSVKGTPSAPEKRFLSEFVKSDTPVSANITQLIIELERHRYSEDFKLLTDPFYLKR